MVKFFLERSTSTTIKIPIKSSFLFKERYGGKFSSKVRVKSAFVVNYKGQNKNIVWNSRLDDNLMCYVKEIEIIKRTGFFGIDIIEDTNLIYQ